MPWDSSNPLYRWKLKHGKLHTGSKRKANKSVSVHKSRVRPMVKRRRSYRNYPRRFIRRTRKMTIPLAPLIGIMATAESGGLLTNLIQGNFANVPSSAAWSFLGYGEDNKVNMGALVDHWTPTIAGLLIHKFVGGNPLNVNRTLERARVPFIRI